jgi:Trypsin-like peptidase domain
MRPRRGISRTTGSATGSAARALESRGTFVAAAVAWTVFAYAGVPAAQAQDLEAAKASVVRVVSKDAGGLRRTGTGFVVRVEPDLVYIATASHVVERDPAPQVEFFARRNRLITAGIARTEGEDPRGIALLMVRGKENIPERLRALPFATEALSGGQDVIAIGFGQGQGDWAVIRANVASIDGRDIRLDGRIEEGNSGGPILKGGQVVGLITRTEAFGHAAPAALVDLILRGWGVAVSRTDTPVAPPPPAAAAPLPEAPESDRRYALRGATATQGRTSLENHRTDLRDGTLILEGVRQPGLFNVVVNRSIETQILRVSNGKPTLLRMNFLVHSMKFMGGAGTAGRDATQVNTLQGKTVIAESSGAEWRFSAPDGALSPAEQQELASTLISDDAMLPPDPVPVGHEWEVSGTALQALGYGEGSATMRLRRIVSCGSEQCAEIEVRLRAASVAAQGILLRTLKEGYVVKADLAGQGAFSFGAATSITGPYTVTGTTSVR